MVRRDSKRGASLDHYPLQVPIGDERRSKMGCGSCGPKKMAKYICAKCGKEELREVKEGEVVKSCCGQTMVKKEK